MKLVLLSALVVAALTSVAQAQERIYRCGNEYTNTVTEAQAKTCKLVSGGNVTVIQAGKVQSPPARVASGASARADSADQRSKDSDARLILEAELKKSEARKADLLKQYNNGEPEREGPEYRNYQKYLDRVAELKASISRNDSDIAGIQRELDRLNGAAVPASGAK